MEKLYFTRKFTKGNLKGLIHNDTITSPDAKACVEWANAINRKNDAGRLDYRIIDKSFQCYFR